MLDRRRFLKNAAILSTLSFLPNLAKGATNSAKAIKASAINSGLVQNGSVISAAHWGILKLTIENGVVVKNEPWRKLTDMDNPLWYQTPDMIYKSRVRFPYVRKSSKS